MVQQWNIERAVRERLKIATALLFAFALSAAAGRAADVKDDRQLLRQSPADPYMFILLDTSGSMNERPGDSTTPIASADDPESKFYQAKQALYTALSNNTDVNYGFSTFNQDDLVIRRKHWIYKAAASPGWTVDALSYPVLGVSYTFGGEDGGGNTEQATCTGPTSLPTSGLVAKLQGWPKTGDLGTTISKYWLRQVSGKTFYTETKIESGALGDATINVRVTRQVVTKCSPLTLAAAQFKIVPFQLVRQTLAHTTFVDDVPQPNTNTCSGMEPNNDSLLDRYRLPTSINLSFAANRKFDRGDFLPLDWTTTNRDELLRRLAPNLRGTETVPDFSVARYFTNTGAAGNPPLVSATQVPFIAGGLTPLGASMNSFRDWFAGCHNVDKCPGGTGWLDVAKLNDPLWGCRRKYLLILTDGDDTCGGGGATGSACQGARALYEAYDIITFVIAFGQVSVSGNVLQCLADNGSGGTIQPFNPQDQTALDNALSSIFERVTQESRAFSSAAVPTVQANFADTIYVPSFTPLNASSFEEPAPASGGAGATWDGHLDAFLKDLPINPATGKPDTRDSASCATANPRTSCHLWDAGKKLLDQSPTMAQLATDPPFWKIGSANSQRRLFYSVGSTGAAIPLERRLLLPQTSLVPYQIDLWEGMGLNVVDPTNPASAAAVASANAKVETTIKYTLGQKVASVLLDRDTTFVLGDIFHSNPVVINAPSRITYFTADVPNQPGTGTSCASGNKGYRCFRLKHQFRRRVVAVGSNDGELHLFDGGIYRDTSKSFDNGTGYELMAYVPRTELPFLYNQARDNHQEWGVDGTVQVDDVFIDPVHAGTPTDTERRWRTVLLGGLREGGSAYYALDVTQPDVFDSSTGLPAPLGGGAADYVPSCWNGGTGCDTVPFGAVLWNFTDGGDEDGNLAPDLGNTWSTPNTGRIRVVRDATLPPTNSARYEDHYVAVFGGGMDPNGENKRGNWLYMVDIETGKTIYKQPLAGSAPSDPAAVDTDLDGYLDRIYIGTTQGFLYKVDLTKDVKLLDVGGGKLRISPLVSGDPLEWAPFQVFDTATNRAASGEVIRPIYFPPSVVFDPRSGLYSLAFGTGNRQDLWLEDATEGRFFFVVDSGWKKGDAVKVETNFTQITATVPAGTDYLISPPTGKLAGWFMALAADERIISKSLNLSGILTFTGFVPKTEPASDGLCQRKGNSNIYTVLSTNANPVLGTTAADRKRTINAFVTNPFVETNFSKNPRVTGTRTPPPTGAVCRPTAETVKTLRSTFPKGCKFTAFTQEIKTFQVDTQLVCIAPIPICVREQNWKEH